MKFGLFTPACAAVAAVLIGLHPQPVKAQSAGAILGGVLGGVIAGSIAAHAMRQRPVVVYARPGRAAYRSRPAPRRAVASRQRPMTPAAGPQGAAIINASADPFASGTKGATTAVRQTQ